MDKEANDLPGTAFTGWKSLRGFDTFRRLARGILVLRSLRPGGAAVSLLRHVVLLLWFFTPLAFADQIGTGYFFGNTGGTITFDPITNTLTLTSTITRVIGAANYGQPPLEETGSDLGTITLTTGPLVSGNILHQGIFDGGILSLIVDTGISSQSGTLYPFTLSGNLTLPLYWHLGTSGYHLTGYGYGDVFLFGTIPDGFVNIYFTQLAVLSGTNQYNVIRGGTTIPEPGTVVLVVTGLGFLACRTKLRRTGLSNSLRPFNPHTPPKGCGMDE
jgi:hypothetical protein